MMHEHEVLIILQIRNKSLTLLSVVAVAAAVVVAAVVAAAAVAVAAELRPQPRSCPSAGWMRQSAELYRLVKKFY